MGTTAVQLRDDDSLRCELLRGTPIRMTRSDHGSVAVFAADSLVIYRIAQAKTEHAVAFRTLDASHPDAVSVPGVYPCVRLLLSVRDRGKVTKLRRLLDYLTSTTGSFETLTDGQIVRLNTLLEQRYFTRRNIRDVIAHA